VLQKSVQSREFQFFMGTSTYSACGSIRASSAARRFFVMMTAAFGGKDSARVVDMLSQREGIL
jgi:hypothetical protein